MCCFSDGCSGQGNRFLISSNSKVHILRTYKDNRWQQKGIPLSLQGSSFEMAGYSAVTPMISLFAHWLLDCEKKNSEKKKKIQWRHTAWFLFSGLLKQVNVVVEKGAIFAPFSVSVILFSGWPKILKQKSLLSH